MKSTPGCRLRRVAVLGSGVMGSGIAAHFANAGIPSLVLDIVPREPNEAERARGLTLDDRRVRDRIAREAVDALLQTKPAPLFSKERRALIETGNLEDDLARLAEADWIVEVVKEDLAIKRDLLQRVAPHVASHAILSTNTSGLSVAKMAEALPPALRPRFLGTHFFNPPRYMRLLEIVPTADTSAGVVDFVRDKAETLLGKGVVRAADTPNFVANRIGVHAMLATFRVLEEEGLTIEEVDALTGPALARPKTATFRLADLVGVDTLYYVAQTLQRETDDECADLFEPPAALARMVEAGLLGRKSGAGFYKRVSKPEKAILTLDLETLDYRPPAPVELPELAPLKKLDDPAKRMEALLFGEGRDGRGARAAWKILAATLSYAAMRVGEIAAEAEPIDRAMKLGFNWELGPFETWDALGFRRVAERLKADGHATPAWIDALLDAGEESLFVREDGRRLGPTAEPGRRAPVRSDPRAVSISALRAAGKVVRENDSASLVDLGEGVLGLEFHAKMNAIDQGVVELCHGAAEEACGGSWRAIVIANDGANFCAGANLAMVVQAIEAGRFDQVEQLVERFQEATVRLESAPVPVVCAPHQMALGGGAEVVLLGHAVQAHAELYAGLVEVGAGLVPAGGGCLRLYRRNLERHADAGDLYPALKATFEAIGMAKVSTSAEEARALGFLRPTDRWTMNRDRLVADARDLALALANAGWQPPVPRPVPVMGRAGAAVIEGALVNLFEGRFISAHDRKIGREVARILSGGDVAGPTEMSAERMLELEREAFLRLCGEAKTRERIVALLKTGKPLRN